MNKKTAEDFIYKSYLKAQKYQAYNAKDSEKRRNDITLDLLRSRSNTPCCVITGSKGKGSVANMISQILQIKYKVGLMTSPHIMDFCERFMVNGEKISEEDFVSNINEIKEDIEAIDRSLPQEVCVSPMGIQAVMALTYFQNVKTDFNIFECGKGAKYDDVNNIKHEYAVINSIFLEHTRELGETLEEIAADKAHVINGEQKCVYIAWQEKDVLRVIEDKAKQYQVPIKVYGRDFGAEKIRYTKKGMLFDVVIGKERYEDIIIPLLGEHQAKNCALAMALCMDIFCQKKNTESEFDLSERISAREDFYDIKITRSDFNKIKEKLQSINWPGRMEVLNNNPFVILDACINSVSCKNVLQVLEHLGIKESTVIIGIPDDKDYAGVVNSMKKVATKIILTKSQNPHYIFSQSQQESLRELKIHTVWTNNIKDALDMAKKEEKPIVILGTTSVIAEVKRLSNI